MSAPDMSHDRSEKEIFFAALEQPSVDARAIFLEGACGKNPALRRRIEQLLAEHFDRDEFMKSAAVEGVPTLLEIVPVTEGPGSQVDRYKLLEKVGEGGGGVVYVAEQTAPVRRRVALKIIKLGMDTKSVVARFEAERQALAMMDHPNIARVLDAGTTQTGRPYFVMELVRGIKITDYCDQEKSSSEERLDLFIKVCQAIQHAHQKGIIHRDIKPSNILVTLHDGVPVPKVIDFGIAKATEGRLTDATVYTQLHQFIGTPAYMSPEQAEMSGLDIDTRSDIYSLGVLLYELLTGSTPFDGKDLMSMGLDAMRKTIREKEPAKPSTRLRTLQGEELTTTAKRRGTDVSKLLNQLRGDLDWIVMKCLEKDRTRRYETASGLAMDIKRYLNNEPVVARPPTVAYRLQKAWRRNKVTYSAVALVLVALVLGTAVSLWQASVAVKARNAARLSEAAKIEEARLAQAARQQAEKNAEIARRNLYMSDMNLAAQALKDNNWGKATRILSAYGRDSSLRGLLGWEWRYMWNETHQTYQLAQLLGHTNYVSGVTFLGENNRIASSSYDKTIRFWDRETGQCTSLRSPTETAMICLQMSTDGSVLAGLSGEMFAAAELTLWDARTREVLARLGAAGSYNGLRNWGFIPNQTEILYLKHTGSSQGELAEARIYNWRTASDRLLQRGLQAYGPIRVSSRGDSALLRYPDGYKILSLLDPKQLISLSIASDGIAWVHAAAISRDGSLVALGLGELIQLYTRNDGKHLADLKGHSAWVSSLIFSADGTKLYSASADQTIRIWDSSTRQALEVYRGHTDEVWDIDLAPDGHSLVSCGKDGSIRLWPAEPPANDDLVLRFLRDNKFQMICRHQAGSTVIALDRELSNQVHLLEVAGNEGAKQRSTRLGDDPILAAAMLSGSTSVLVASAKNIALWDPDSGRKIKTAYTFSAPITQASPGFMTSQGLLYADELEAGTTSLQLSMEPVTASAFNRQAGLKAVGLLDGRVRLMTSGRSEVQGEWQAQRHGVTGLCFSPDGSRLYTGGLDGFARVWDVVSHTPIGPPMRSQLMSIHAMALSPDGYRLATGSIEAVTIWDPDQHRELATFSVQKAVITSLGFLSDDILVAYGEGDGGGWMVWRAPPLEAIDWSAIGADEEASLP